MAGALEAGVCRSCGYTEFYVKDPGTIPVDGKHVREVVGAGAASVSVARPPGPLARGSRTTPRIEVSEGLTEEGTASALRGLGIEVWHSAGYRRSLARTPTSC